MRVLISLFLILLLYNSCTETVSFKEPQPTDAKSFNEFPERLQGSYIDEDGISLLKIGANLITKTYDYNIKVAKKDLESNGHLVNDTVYVSNDREKISVKMEGDSVWGNVHSVDTIFLISNKNVLRKFMGYYMLNYADSIYWHVDKLSLSKGNLSISRISTGDDVKNLREITEKNSDTTSYKFNPTKKQLREFIKKGGFTETEDYKRIKE